MPWWYTKYVSLVHYGRVGGGTGQGPATEVTCFVKSTSNISSRCYLSTCNTAIVPWWSSLVYVMQNWAYQWWSTLFLTSWQTVAQYLGLTENDMKILNKKEKWERKDARSPSKMEGQNLVFKETYRKLVEVMLSLSVADIAGKVCHLLQSCSCIQV